MRVLIQGNPMRSTDVLEPFTEQCVQFAIGPVAARAENVVVSMVRGGGADPRVDCDLSIQLSPGQRLTVHASDEDEYLAIERAADLAGMQLPVTLGEPSPLAAH